jgi:hypothetical protein
MEIATIWIANNAVLAIGTLNAARRFSPSSQAWRKTHSKLLLYEHNGFHLLQKQSFLGGHPHRSLNLQHSWPNTTLVVLLCLVHPEVRLQAKCCNFLLTVQFLLLEELASQIFLNSQCATSFNFFPGFDGAP